MPNYWAIGAIVLAMLMIAKAIGVHSKSPNIQTGVAGGSAFSFAVFPISLRSNKPSRRDSGSKRH